MISKMNVVFVGFEGKLCGLVNKPAYCKLTICIIAVKTKPRLEENEEMRQLFELITNAAHVIFYTHFSYCN